MDWKQHPFPTRHREPRRRLPRGARPLLALGIMVVAVFVASSVGIINLIGQGYRYSSYFFLVSFSSSR